MIDEKRLVEQLNELKDKCWDRAKKENNINFARKQLDISQVIGIINIQPKIGGWIPCSERLPEVEQTVLLSLRSLDVSVGFRANTDGYFYTEGEGYVLYENVLAWQPLPEAYHG